MALQASNTIEKSRHMTGCVCEIIWSKNKRFASVEKIVEKSIKNQLKFDNILMIFEKTIIFRCRIWHQKALLRFISTKRNFPFYFNRQTNPIYHISNFSTRFIYGEHSTPMLHYFRDTAIVQFGFFAILKTNKFNSIRFNAFPLLLFRLIQHNSLLS